VVRRARAARRADGQIRQLVDAYLSSGSEDWSEGGVATRVEDLATGDPDRFWQFLELLLENQLGLNDLVALGRPLTSLLRYHPDLMTDGLASAARQSRQMRDALTAVDSDRVAPDVWKKVSSAIFAD